VALEIALKGADKAGAQVELFDARTLDLPMSQPGRRAARKIKNHA
jgi:hypothetical protein